ncbi:RNA-binding protein [Gracilibacillus salitolerans]|uniref:RNA-binding protein n=1 Tax=Gracilibacillus salitolerans TaxID=2663022 RepID=A0A5Q2TFD7_9BACI|nr:CGNR zinc finger domain-containing protein [Gracilibacillus salitolerans]QGH32917.1 RNA-binding protein [Gracilibacillus salitolerans]
MKENIKFPLISGNISLDLVNTEVVRHGVRHDLLTDKEHVKAWIHTLLSENIVLTQQFDRKIDDWSEQALDLLREMRAYLREHFEKVADGKEAPSEMVALLEERMKQAPFTYQLIDNKLVPVPLGDPAQSLMSLIVMNGLQLIASGDLDHLHRCSNPECVLLFIDKRGRRKWCSMQICGNRVKVTRHHKRKKEEK